MNDDKNVLTASEETALKRVEERRGKAYEKLRSIDDSVQREDVIVIFGHDLAPRVSDENESSQIIDGLCCLTRDRLYVYINGKREKEIPLADACDFRITAGVGSVSCECTAGGCSGLFKRHHRKRRGFSHLPQRRVAHRGTGRGHEADQPLQRDGRI